jgi:hypothetical protein
MSVSPSEISVVIQGSCISPQPLETFHYVRQGIHSVRQYLPGARIILSTWKGETLPDDLDVDLVLFNEDPGCRPRGEASDSKPNNVNRQVVSSYEGIKRSDRTYTLKMRTDFAVTGGGFLDFLGIHPAYNAEYKVFRERVVVCMFGTRKPFGKHYNLPFHVSDFACFGRTCDLANLYDIPLVTDEEFDYFRHRPDFQRGTFAVNRYNAEQSIIINFLRKNGKTVSCSYSTHVDKNIQRESDLFLVNNFVPLSFARYGIRPQKSALFVKDNIEKYTDYYTLFEWLSLYKQYCDLAFSLPDGDIDRQCIESAIEFISHIRLQEKRIRENLGGNGTALSEVMQETKRRFLHELERLL